MPFQNRARWYVALCTLVGVTAVGACSSTKSSTDAGADGGGRGGHGGGGGAAGGASAAGSGGAAAGSGGQAGSATAGAGGQTDAGACRMQGESCTPPQHCCGPLICAGVCTMGVGQGGPPDGASTEVASDGGHACGSSTCRANQVCVHPSCGGGTAPMCFVAPNDAGQCPQGSTYQPHCAPTFGPGCLPAPCVPAPPFCADIPASCGGHPSCVCLPPNVCNGGGSCGLVDSTDAVICGSA
jgi:hypothetical protein